jgi:hypothetical protein
MKKLNDLLGDIEDYIAWIKETNIPAAEENIRRLLAGVLDYDPNEEIVFVEAVNSPPINTDPTVKFMFVSARSPITRQNLEHAGRLTLGYGSNLFLYIAGTDIKVVNVEIEKGEIELETMMEFNFLRDDPEEIATHLWTLSKKDCGKKVLVARVKP